MVDITLFVTKSSLTRHIEERIQTLGFARAPLATARSSSVRLRQLRCPTRSDALSWTVLPTFNIEPTLQDWTLRRSEAHGRVFSRRALPGIRSEIESEPSELGSCRSNSAVAPVILRQFVDFSCLLNEWPGEAIESGGSHGPRYASTTFGDHEGNPID